MSSRRRWDPGQLLAKQKSIICNTLTLTQNKDVIRPARIPVGGKKAGLVLSSQTSLSHSGPSIVSKRSQTARLHRESDRRYIERNRAVSEDLIDLYQTQTPMGAPFAAAAEPYMSEDEIEALKEDIKKLGWTTPATSTADIGDAKTMLDDLKLNSLALARVQSTVSSHDGRNGPGVLEGPQNALLDMEGAVSESGKNLNPIGGLVQSAIPALAMSSLSNDTMQMLAELDPEGYTVSTNSISTVNGSGRPSMSPANLETTSQWSTSPIRDAPKQMLADPERNAPSINAGSGPDLMDAHELEELRRNLYDTFFPHRVKEETFSETSMSQALGEISFSSPPKGLDTAATSPVAPLKLEQPYSGRKNVPIKSEHAIDDDSGGHNATSELQDYIRRCNENLEQQIQEVLAGEQKAMERRVFITNIAAGAEEEDLEAVFVKFKVQDLRMLKERHPKNGTRAAYVDFYDKLGV